jgi:hypothetical protein
LVGWVEVVKDLVFKSPLFASVKKVSVCVQTPLTKNETPMSPGVSAESDCEVYAFKSKVNA